MTSDPDRGGETPPDTEDTLTRLGVQVEALQALLVRLLQDVVNADASRDARDSAPLVEANEKLVLAALAHQVQAETAARALDAAEKAARMDTLTGLPNRATLMDRLSQAIAASRRRGSRLAVIFLDLDDFKALNDAHGHPFGDKALQLAAQRMLAVVREVDTVSRYGGDEFLILLTELNQIADATRVADKLLASIAAPAQIEGIAVDLCVSLGVAIFPDDADDASNLIAKADAAMYASKRQRVAGMVQPGDRSMPSATPFAASDATQPAAISWRNEDLRDANEKLILAALSAQELREAAELARQRQNAVIVAVAEELSNPNAPIRIATAMLGRLASDEPALVRVRSILEAQVAHTSHLIGNLLGAAEPEADGLVPKLEAVDMNEVIDAGIARQRGMMDARSQHLAIERPPNRLDVRGDALMLELVVSNLLDNASKHTYNGGQIALSIARNEDSIVLTVTDNGIGITPSILPYISAPFFQDTQALGFNGVGLGIGLTVVRTLVRAHGGTFTAYSAGLKRGARFVITLPVAQRVQDPAAFETLSHRQ